MELYICPETLLAYFCPLQNIEERLMHNAVGHLTDYGKNCAAFMGKFESLRLLPSKKA